MNNNQMIVQQETNPMMIIDGIKLDRVQQSMSKIQQFQKVIQNTLVEGHDYGAAFYGAAKPSLLKPGAEKILMLLGLSSEYEIIEKIQDYDEGFFAYTVRCVLKKNGMIITEGLGHCNSKEKKYEGEKQDKYMLGNTCLKMAKKRAQVDATLTVASLSEVFTQDIEDMKEFIQQEQLSNLTEVEAENLKINFGKFKDKTLKEIYNIQPDYMKWLADNARDEVVKKAAAMILNSNKQTKPANANTNYQAKEQDVPEIPDEDDTDLPWNDDENVPF